MLKFLRKENKGITLVALVITIILLLILAGITISQLTGNGLFEKAKQAKEQSEIASIKEEIQIEIYNVQIENNGNITDGDLEKILGKYGELSNEEKLTDRTLTTKKGSHEIKVLDIFNETTKEDKPKGPIISDKSGANEPKGNITGKTYVMWKLNESTNTYGEIETQEQPDNWYDYENGKWANIKTTNNELEAYWVWIPRYEYKVPTSDTATQIDVRFIPKSKTQADEGYTIHPAFTSKGGFGELDGIWVAKFEASSNTTNPDENYGGGDPTTENPLKVQVKPGVQSWRNISTNNIFTVCRKMTGEGEVLEGSTVDSHMMKNIEWGAVAILSQSKYGIFNSQSSTGENGDSTYQIWNNSNGYNTYKNVYTGYAGNSKDASITYNSTTAPNVYEYNNINGTKASTTGTVYGVYDMAGGSWEYVAGCLNGQENAKFGVAEGNFKYVDLYTNSNNSSSNYDGAKIGDATKETKGWNNDFSEFVYSSYPVFNRSRLLPL